jgi:hypothetical protein
MSLSESRVKSGTRRALGTEGIMVSILFIGENVHAMMYTRATKGFVYVIEMCAIDTVRGMRTTNRAAGERKLPDGTDFNR